MRSFSTLIFILLLTHKPCAQQYIYLNGSGGKIKEYAALELQRYIFQLTNKILPVQKTERIISLKGFVLITPSKNVNKADTRFSNLGEEGYRLVKKGEVIFIYAKTETGCLYGVYGLLEDYYAVGFYPGGDVIPFPKKKFYLPEVSEIKNPSVAIRGFLPWTNFPQSATVYSWDDWKFIIDQAARMRMNFINIHNYNGEAGHNEMFHNFSLDGYMSRVWMPTAKTGHGWSCKGFEVKNFHFGAEEIFDDYDFGADCALHNETLSNEIVFRKGVSLFQRVIEYAHTRGVKIALGLDIDLILPEYKTTADNPKIIEARMKQVLDDYPGLDYLVLYISELIVNKPDKLLLWKRAFDGMYAYLKQHSRFTKVAVSGWGLSKAIADSLPEDVIAAPIAAYSDAFEDGSIYGNREYWGCPWMERDFFSSEYYYPFGMDLSNTINAWQARAKNMKGFYTLTWRLTDAIEPKLSFVAKAPWDDKNKFKTSYDVYYDYAVKNYGNNAAPAITGIINQNEPFSSNDAECQPTGVFNGQALEQSNYLLNIHKMELKQHQKKISILFAYRYDSIEKAGIEKREDADSCVAFVQDGSFILFKNTDFGSGIDSVISYAATSYPYAAVEIVIDSINGKSIGTASVPNTGGWHNWKAFTTAVNKTTGVHDVYFIFKSTVREQEQIEKANQQIFIIQQLIDKEKNKNNIRRMKYVQARLVAGREHLQLSHYFPYISKPGDLPSFFPSWIKNFTHRVTDISSLGNVQSIQNRYVQERYLAKENELQQKVAVKFPTHIKAKGTLTGAIITWHNNEKNCRGFNIYVNQQRVNKNVLPSHDSVFYYNGNGRCMFQVTSLNNQNEESVLSPAAICHAGNTDEEAPHIIIISPPQSIRLGSLFSIKARLLDERKNDILRAYLFYRMIGKSKWNKVTMQRKVNAVFTAGIKCDKTGVMEYYVLASDGVNKAAFPAQSGSYLSAVIERSNRIQPGPVKIAALKGNIISWEPVALKKALYIKVYRSSHKNFLPSSANFLTYLPVIAYQFEDNGINFNGDKLKGNYYYRVTTVSIDEIESHPSQPVKILY